MDELVDIRSQQLALTARAFQHGSVCFVSRDLENRALPVLEAVSAEFGRRLITLSTRSLRHIHKRIRPELLQLVAITLTLPITKTSVLFFKLSNALLARRHALLARRHALLARRRASLELENRLLHVNHLPVERCAKGVDGLLALKRTECFDALNQASEHRHGS